MQNTHPKEQIMVVPADIVAPLCCYRTYGPPSPALEKIILDNHSFRDRKEAETNFAYKQVIPYVMVIYIGDGPASQTKYLLSQRTSQQQETRLHNKYSLGQGGHINDLDMSGTLLVGAASPIMAGLMREISEEFHLGEIASCNPTGLINDDKDDVGRVHFGLVYTVRVASLDMSVAEEGKHTAQWVTQAELKAYYDRMENWTKILMDHVIRPA